jgi:hypothetical protein
MLGILAVFLVGVIFAVIFARANASWTSSSSPSIFNPKGDLREWQNAAFFQSIELYETP